MLYAGVVCRCVSPEMLMPHTAAVRPTVVCPTYIVECLCVCPYPQSQLSAVMAELHQLRGSTDSRPAPAVDWPRKYEELLDRSV